MLYAIDFGAKFDGTTDDSAAIQAAINAADSQGEPLMLPGRTAVINTALDLRGRTVEIYGTANKTQLLAGTVGMTMVNVEENDDQVYSPFKLQGMILNGRGRAAFCLRVRYRHHSELNEILVQYATSANIWEQDTWISRRYNCRSEGGPVGWQLEGSNFGSAFYGCYNAYCTTAQWLINNNGSLLNGNNALHFSNCGATDAAGAGIVVNGHVVANFVDCYVGENLDETTVINNGGTVVFDGGTISFGWKPTSFLCRPIGGETILQTSTQINGQDFGTVNRLSFLSEQQVAAGAGTLRLDDVKGYMITGGDQAVPGDPIGYGEQRNVLVPRLGRQFEPVGNNTTFTSSNPMPNSRRLTCNSVTGSNPIIGFYAPLSLAYRVGEPFYLLLVYQSSKPLQVRIDSGVLGAPVALLSFPPAADAIATHIKLDAPIPAASAGAVLEILMPNAAANDIVEISECFLTDSTMAKKGIATVSRVFKC